MPPQGSVTRTEPLYETVTANITEQPADQTIEKVGNHPFKATAEHGGVAGEGFTTVVVKKNNPPEIKNLSIRPLKVEKGEQIYCSATANDKEDGDLTSQIFWAPGGATGGLFIFDTSDINTPEMKPAGVK